MQLIRSLKKNSRSRLFAAAAVCSIVMQLAIPIAAYATPPSAADQDSLKAPWENWVAEQGNGCAEASTGAANDAVITGKNVKDAFLFFTSNGMDANHAAAIVGNMIIESGVDPTAINTQIGIHYGIVQWGGDRLTGMRAFVRGEGKDPAGLSGQLDYVLHELQTSYSGVFKDFQKETTVAGAVHVWNEHYEVSGTSDSPRLAAANGVLKKYGNLAGSGDGTVTDTTSSGCDASAITGSPDCKTATGVAKILCEALKYDPVSYEESIRGGHQGAVEWHKTCPVINASCVLDCSGLVNIATYDAFGVDGRWNTTALRDDTSNWKHISASQLQPGDLVEPFPGHVEIVDKISGGRITTFGAHTSHYPQPKQVSIETYMNVNDPGNLYLQYVGKGI